MRKKLFALALLAGLSLGLTFGSTGCGDQTITYEYPPWLKAPQADEEVKPDEDPTGATQ